MCFMFVLILAASMVLGFVSCLWCSLCCLFFTSGCCLLILFVCFIETSLIDYGCTVLCIFLVYS